MKFKQSIKAFFTSKSNWLGLSMITGGAIALFNEYQTSQTISQNAVESILAGFALLFVRDGIAGMGNA